MKNRTTIFLLFCARACIVVISALTAVAAQTDTLTIRGKVENLTLRLYRLAPQISIARVNVLQPQSEIVRVAQLQPNGSFECTMPLIYPQEECYLTYGNVVIPFLAQKGTVEVTIYGDSLAKTDLPLRFGGVNAATNNHHGRFYTAFNKWLKANPEKPNTAKDSERFWQQASSERERRLDFYRSFVSTNDTLLDKWVISSLTEAAKSQYYNFLTQSQEFVPLSLTGAMRLDTSQLLTFSKTDAYQKFMSYVESITPAAKEMALPINTLSKLILQYVPGLTPSDSVRLLNFAEKNTAKARDVSFLSSLFEQKEEVLKPISTYEIYVKKYKNSFSARELDYLKGAFYSNNVHSYLPKQMQWLYNHIRPSLTEPLYVKALDEIHHVESADSTLINKHSDTGPGTLNEPLEIMPGVLLTKKGNYTQEAIFWSQLKQKFQGKNVYFIFWANDELGRNALAEAQMLRARLPEQKVAFVYICEYQTPESLWVQSVIKSKAKGLHIWSDESLTDFFVGQWGISRIPHCTLIDPSGKYISRDAPLPQDREGWNKIWDKVIR